MLQLGFQSDRFGEDNYGFKFIFRLFSNWIHLKTLIGAYIFLGCEVFSLSKYILIKLPSNFAAKLYPFFRYDFKLKF